jgi:hypothetical protein
MYWSWFITSEMQLSLLVPLYAIVYKRAPVIAAVVGIVLILFNIGINMEASYRYDLKAGAFALENYYLFDSIFRKPYSKIGSH